MSIHAIAWFNDEDVLDLNDAPKVEVEARCERRWDRIKLDCRVRVTFNIGKATETIDGQGNDISGGGISLYVPAELNEGDQVTIELVRRYGKPRVMVAAQVMNKNGFRYGMEFAGLKDEQREEVVTSFTQDLHQ
jgi:hypothetical protein